MGRPRVRLTLRCIRPMDRNPFVTVAAICLEQWAWLVSWGHPACLTGYSDPSLSSELQFRVEVLCQKFNPLHKIVKGSLCSTL